MDELNPIFISGIAVFGAGSALISLAFGYFVWSRRQLAKKYAGDEWDIKWSHSLWIYAAAWFACINFMFLYLLQYYAFGFTIKPDLRIGVWLRWFLYALVGGVYMGILNYVMTHRPHGAQSLFSLLTYVLSIVAISFATCAYTEEQRIIFMVYSLVFFIAAILLLVWPDNKIWTEGYYKVTRLGYSETSIWRIMFGYISEKYHESALIIWAFVYRLFLLINIVLSYVGLVITWFLSDANEFTDVAGLHSTLLSYLIFDIVFIIPFTILFANLTFAGMTKKASIGKKDQPGGHRIIESYPPLYNPGFV